MGFDIRFQDLLHTRKVSLSLTFEKLEHIRIKFQVNGSRLFRLDHAGIRPKVRPEVFTFEGCRIAG